MHWRAWGACSRVALAYAAAHVQRHRFELAGAVFAELVVERGEGGGALPSAAHTIAPSASWSATTVR